MKMQHDDWCGLSSGRTQTLTQHAHKRDGGIETQIDVPDGLMRYEVLDLQ